MTKHFHFHFLLCSSRDRTKMERGPNGSAGGSLLLKAENTSHNHHQNFMCDNLVNEASGDFNYVHPFTGTQ